VPGDQTLDVVRVGRTQRCQPSSYLNSHCTVTLSVAPPALR
jgi:hypothetical protein